MMPTKNIYGIFTCNRHPQDRLDAGRVWIFLSRRILLLANHTYTVADAIVLQIHRRIDLSGKATSPEEVKHGVAIHWHGGLDSDSVSTDEVLRLSFIC